MKLDSMEVFCAVAKTGSFKGAANLLKRPTSTISRMIADLESELGQSLLHRTTRRVTLSGAGSELFRAVEPVVAQLRREVRRFTQDSPEISGQITITVPSLLARQKVGPILMEFGASHPKLRLRVDTSTRNLDLLGEGIDIALRFGPLPDSSLVATRIWRSDYVMAVKAELLPEMAKMFERQDLDTALKTVPCVVCAPMRFWEFQTQDGGQRTVRPNAVVEVDDLELAANAVSRGLGIGFLPAGFQPKELPLLMPLPLKKIRPRPRELYAVTPPGQTRSATIRELISYLKRSL